MLFTLKRKPLCMAVLAAALAGGLTQLVHSQTSDEGQNTSSAKFKHSGSTEQEGPPDRRPATEAPTGFDNVTNGYLNQGPAFNTLNSNNVVAGRSFNDNRFVFEEVETVTDGLGPTFNGQSCRECHQNVATGGASQVAEHRTGRMTNGVFFESLGGSLIQSRATNPDIVERVAFQDDIRTFRISTNT